jgi:hypothetical protein
MASQDRPPAPRRPGQLPPRPPAPERLTIDLKKSIDFDPKRVSIPQIAVVGFIIGILFHACVVFAILDDGSGSKAVTSGNIVTDQVTPVATATATPLPGADRTDCAAIRADPTYRSETERQWFLKNCIS